MLGWILIAGLAALVLLKRQQVPLGAGLQWPAGTQPATATAYPTGPIGFPASQISPAVLTAYSPGPGAPGAPVLQTTGALVGTAAGTAAGGVALVGAAGGSGVLAGAGAAAVVPVAGAVAAGAIALGYGLYRTFNHPYGTCGPNAKTSEDFLRCWKHAIPDSYIPYGFGAGGWHDNFAVCFQARGGRAPAGGCAPYGQMPGPKGTPVGPVTTCSCPPGLCVCAPIGAHSWENGAWV